MKKVLSLLLSITMLLSISAGLDLTAYAQVLTGSCGENVTYTLDTDSGVLTISGTGEMYDYSSNSYVPWHSHSSSVKTVVIEYGVTSIGREAFDSCSSLTSVTIPNSVTSIGNRAFEGCKSLTSITIPNSVTRIGDNAFYSCDSLTSITIPNSVTSIGAGAFYSCDSLTCITIPNSVTSIGDNAFWYCYSLTSITVDGNNQNYSSQDGVLFDKYKTILIQYPIGNTRTSYTISNSVTSIHSYAFYDCDSLTSITMPNSVTSIGDYAFCGCNSLTSVTIPNSVTSIGDYAFGFCDSLTSITIPNSVTSIGDNAFCSCDSLTSITIPNSVTSIGAGAFSSCNSLTSITIPNSVTSIGNSAFSNCDSLTSITIPNSVTSIGDYAFHGCYSLISIIVDGNNQNYSSQDGVLFNKDKTILIQYPVGNTRTSYTIPNSVITIGDAAFENCYSLTSITIPNSVITIGDYAFEYCYSLTSITVDGNNQNYSSQDGALFNKDKTVLIQYPTGNTRTSYTIPNSVTSIGDYAFYRCYSLTSITIPNSVTSIGDDAFEYCDSLTSITIPNSVTSIGNSAFDHCNSLTSVTIGNSVTSIGPYAFYDCNSLTSVTIENSVTSIGYYAFYSCDSLTSITIPNSVTRIGYYAFYDCNSLTSITIPNRLTSIGYNAFYYCSSLTDVYYSGNAIEWNNISIEDGNDDLLNATIHYNSSIPGIDLPAYEETTHPTSTNSLYSNKFQSILDGHKSTKYYDSMYKSFVCIIPGIEQTNTGDGTYSNYMTPQGVCVAGSYILITAYDGINDYYKEMDQSAPESKKNSVIYVLDKNTNKYLVTLVLDSKCHVGGISYNQKAGLIYVADSDNKQVCMLNFSDIAYAVNTKQDAVKVNFSRCVKVSVNPSFLTYYGGYLYVGNFVDNKANEKDSILKAYNPISLAEINNSTIKIPLKSQGVAFINYDNEIIMTVSCSYGRKNKSQVFAYRMKKSGNLLQKVSEFDCYKFPEMAEGICVYGDKFLTCYESAAARYQNKNSEKGKCANPIDRITANSISKVAESYYKTMSLSENEPKSTEEFESVVLSGSCGDDAEYVLYSNGLFNITGQGKLYDYAENEAPWSDYTDEILAVAIAPDIDSIGKNSFVSCNNLAYVVVSDFSDINETFTISSNAFVNCNAIDTVLLPNKSINISDDAFKNSSTQMTIISDSQDAINYAEKNNLSIHNHNYKFVKTIAPTCGSNGYDIYECSCNNQELRNVTKATDNHNYVLSEDTKVCLKGETRLYTCTKCQSTYDEVLTDDCHSFNGIKCTVCNEPDPSYNPPSTDPAPGPSTGGGGSIGGGGGGGIVPAPTPEEPTTTEPATQPSTKPTVPTTTTAQSSIKKPKSTSIKKLTKGTKSFKVTWKKKTGVSGYQVQYATDKKFKKNKKTVTIAKKNATSKTIKKLKSKKTYYVRVRTYKIVNGKKVYSSWSKVKAVKTK